MKASGFLLRINLLFASTGLLEGEGPFSLSTENGLISVDGASGFPAVDVQLRPRFNSIKMAGFGNFTFFFRGWGNPSA